MARALVLNKMNTLDPSLHHLDSTTRPGTKTSLVATGMDMSRRDDEIKQICELQDCRDYMTELTYGDLCGGAIIGRHTRNAATFN